MKDWGLAHRFAGSAATARRYRALFYDALRRKSSSAWIMGEPSPRAEILGALRQTRDLDADAIAALFSGEGHGSAKLTEDEYARLKAADLSGAPAHVVGDFPEWLTPQVEGRALAQLPRRRGQGAGRAGAGRPAGEPCSSTTRDKALAALAYLGPQPTPLSPVGLRIAIRPDGLARRRSRPIPFTSRASSRCRTRSSQLAALLAEAKPGMQVLDLCAGGGGQDAGARRRHGQPGPGSTRPTLTRGASRRSSPGSPDRERAMSRCGPSQGGKRTCSPISKGGAIWC